MMRIYAGLMPMVAVAAGLGATALVERVRDFLKK